MNIKNLTKDVGKVFSTLREVEDTKRNDKMLVTLKGCKLYIPVRFTERGLATVGVETVITGIAACTIEDKYYGVFMVNAMMRITPNATNRVVVDGDEYFEFVFEPGAIVTPSLTLLRQNTLVYRIYDEFISKGRAPWYIDYPVFARLFDSAKKHAGANIGADHEVTELIVSLIARDQANRRNYYRQVINSPEDLVTNPPVYIPLKSVMYSATNTTNKLAGSYMQDGIISALDSPSDRVERIEGLLLR